MEIKAKLSALDFYNQKSGLEDGAYEVVEHDGEINIAVLQGLKEIRWYDQGEWTEAQDELQRELMFEGNMRSMDDWDSLLDDPNDGLDDVDPSHYNDCNGCGTCHLCDDHLSIAGDYTARNYGHMNEGMGGDCSARNLDETPLKNKYPESVKTLGELLREQLNDRPTSE
ncbi:hypothetical protein PHABIO_164 [Pseudomonas phage Phabio]|uniref:Uncharacterized protein n=1 Tax=Pseudomonas phage Phabio TaxID=2006668 RepID=A0A1Y0SWE0_9CAUD|nr:hypothetical protein MZD05_gp164 [Pseudomonas phage Phabio]ARV76795.1 hypothetical protein PHABIO_164 [Pseudomonas phage Phabio]